MVLVMQPRDATLRGSWEPWTRFSEGCWGQAKCGKAAISARSLSVAIVWNRKEEAQVAVKTPRYWRCQNSRAFAKESCMMQHSRLKRLSVPKEWSWRAGLRKPFGAQMIPTQAPDPMHATAECHLPYRLSALLWSQHSLPYLSSLFWNGNVCSVPLYIGRM